MSIILAVLEFFGYWLLLSIPLGIVIGKCMAYGNE